jgi:hypothetical protein
VVCLFGVVVLAALCRAPASLAADPGYVLPGPDALSYSVAGGGSAKPTAGRPATAVRLHPREAVFMDDGRIVIRDSEYADAGRLIAVRPDGRIADLPPFGPRPVKKDFAGYPLPTVVYDIDVEQDGGLLAVLSGEPSMLRLGPDGWSPVPSPKGVTAAAALPDGGILALTDGKAWWLTRDGTVVTSRRLPNGVNGTGEFTQSVTPLPGGGFVAGSIGGDVYAVLGRPGRPFQRLAGLGGDDVGFDDLPDGSLLAARGRVSLLPPAARIRSRLFGGHPAIGPGDGGPARRALLAAAGVNTGPSGAVLVAEPAGLRHDVPLTVDAHRAAGRVVTDVYALDDNESAGALRWIGAPPAGRLLASIGPDVYRQLAGGHVPVVTSIGGEARAVVRSGRRLVAQGRATVAAGTGDVFLGRSLPQGDYRVELTVTNGTQIMTYRLGVSTRRTLSLRRGSAAIRRGIDGDGEGDGADGVYFTAKRCRRRSATRVSCAYLAVSYSLDRSTTRCAGTVSAYLRGDGIRIVRDRTRRHRCKLAR